MGLLVQCVLFDLDDTLIETGPVYRKAVYDVIDMIGATGIDVTNAHDLFQEVEVHFIKQYGFKKERFPLSLVDLYNLLCQQQGVQANPVTAKLILDRVWSIYDHDYKVLDGVEQLLQTMKYAGYRMLLVTKGDEEVQRTKAERAGLTKYFEEVIVVADKDAETWATVAIQQELTPHLCFVVGDSVKSDINASIRAGFNAIHIPPPHEWFWERETPEPTALSKHHISELLDTFKVRPMVQQAWAYENRPERELKRACADGYLTMVKHHDLRSQMPDCPGLSYLLTKVDDQDVLHEIHAVFQRDYIELPPMPDGPTEAEVPGIELARIGMRWAPNALSADMRTVRHKDLSVQLCAGCERRVQCAADGIVNGVKVPS